MSIGNAAYGSFRSSHAMFLAGVSVVALLMSGSYALARPLGGFSAATSAPVIASDAAALAAQQAAAMAKQSQASMLRAMQAIQAARAAQAAARAAAGSATVPDGLVAGGLQVGSGPWQNANLPTQTTGSGGVAVEIKQTGQQAILSWQTFNVGANTTVHFNQTGGTQADGTNAWIALNRVTDPSGVPSQILGTIKAEGAVYLINRNGIIFGGTSQVNAQSLVASSLDLPDPTKFPASIVNPTQYNTATSSLFGPIFANTSTTPAGDVTVQPGAVIQTAPSPSVTVGGGNVYLFGSNVTNGGTIITPDGQAVLAAGSAVYLTQSMDPNVRGVEVNLLNGGTVTNTLQGLISAPTGNITMAGLNVRQSGVLSSTTSVNEAGSISLIAHDGVASYSVQVGNGLVYYAMPTRLGTVELSPGSTVAILPEENGLTAYDGQPQSKSVVKLEGLTVNVLGGAQIVAPSGNVALRTSNNPINLFAQDYPAISGVYTSPVPDAGRVYVGDGAVIDVSGLQEVSVPASEDAFMVNVRSNELRDSPLQRNGVLFNKNVWVNIHDLAPVAADRIYTEGGLLEVSGWLGLVLRSIDERLTAGGSVSVFSTGDTIMRPGAFINIAGGSIQHQAGYVNGTRLVGVDGRIYDINTAPPDMIYAAVCCSFSAYHSWRWGVTETYAGLLMGAGYYQSAYVEGKNAGSLTIGTYHGEFDAVVDADAINGVYQRTAATLPQRGALTVGMSTVLPNNVVIAPTTAALADVFANNTVTSGTRDPSTLLPQDWQNNQYLSAAVLDAPSYGSITINSGPGYTVNGNTVPGGIAVTGGATVKVADGGAIALTTAGSISLNGGLIAHAGSVTLITASTPAVTPLNVILQTGAAIDVTGLWTNDVLSGGLPTPTLYNGGNVTINAYGSITVSSGASIDASSGGWLQRNDEPKLANGLPVGTGGNITLATNLGTTSGDVYSSYVTLAQSGSLRSYGMTAGGVLSIVTRDIQIGGSAPSDNTALWLNPSLFASGGFGGYNLISYQGLTIAAGTDLELHSQILIPNQNAEVTRTGSSVFSLATLGAPLPYQNAAPVNLLLSAVDPLNGVLVVGKGAVINADPGATVSLHASRQLTFDGVIDAPAGTINLDLYGLASDSIPRHAPATYDSSTTLWIGADAELLARGMVQTYLSASDRPAYRLLDGGSVNINENGTNAAYYPYANYLQAPVNNNAFALGAVVARPGSLIDVSGVSGVVSAPARAGLVPLNYSVATNGGALNILAAQGLFLDGSVNAQGGGPNASGGSLTIDQTMWATGASGYVQPIGELVVTQSSQLLLPASLNPGARLPSALQGQLYISADKIMGAGFSNVSLGAVDAVVFSGNVSLETSRSLTLNVSTLSATPGAIVSLASPYIDIGAGQRTLNVASKTPVTSTNPFAGTATFWASADLIDIEGTLRSGASTVSLPGFAAMNFTSSGDIRLVPSSSSGPSTQFSTKGDLIFTGAQVYPITSAPTSNVYQSGVDNHDSPQSLFKIAAGGTITINPNGPTPPVPLSAGGMVELIAPTIKQNGVLRAPFGQIIFGDPSSPSTALNITLSPGSITSVSGDGLLIPYGGPQGALYYIYGYNGTSPNLINMPIEKVIGFYGKSVNVAGTVDEAGSGDLYGYQFVSGAGGSVDTLNGVNTFAVLPSLGSTYAPRSPLVDSSNGDSSVSAPKVNLQVGDRIYLSGMPGLPAGYYTLLPGHYALLPGAFEVTVAASNVAPSALGPNLRLPSGAYHVSGYRSVANTTISASLPSEFIVTPGSLVRQQSQYLETTASQFFQNQANQQNVAAPRLPVDAGRIVLDALNAITFTGQTSFSTVPGGRGGEADIVGTNLELLGPGDTATPGYIALDAGLVGRLGAQSVLIGGLRSISSTNSNQLLINNPATNIEISSRAVLEAPEIMLRAGNSITLDPGAVIDTANSGALPDYFPLDPSTGLTLGSIALTNGAFVIASNAPSALPVLLTLPTSGAATGSINIGAGARLLAGSSIALATITSFSLDASSVFGAPTISLTAPTINLGSGGASGVTLTSAMLRRLTAGDPTQGVAAANSVTLNALLAMNVYGAATLSGAGGSLLTINAPVIRGFGAAGDVATISAGRLMLTNGSVAGTASASGTGSLAFDTTELTLGAGSVGFAGFGNVTFDAAAQVIGSGTGVYNTAGNFTMAAPLVTAKASADTTLNATGVVSFTPSADAAQPVLTAIQSLGAHLTVNAASITQGTDISLRSGVITLNGANGVTLGAGSITDVSGATTVFFDVARIETAGTVNLSSTTGNVSVAPGAIVNLDGGDLSKVSGSIDLTDSDLGSNAGALNIVASNGTAQISGTVLGLAVPGYDGGTANLNLAYGTPGYFLGNLRGFTHKLAVTVGSGNLVIDQVTAQDAEFSAASGSITVTGMINASGTNGGTIRLTAGGNLVIGPDAVLDAHATTASGDAGNVFLAIGSGSSGTLNLATGSTINVSGSGLSGGKVWLRAPRTSNDVAIANGDLKAGRRVGGVTVIGAREIDVEAVRHYDITSNPYVDQNIGTADTDAQAYVAAFIANAATTSGSGIGAIAATPVFHLIPGIELDSKGDMSLLASPSRTNTGIDLHTYRYNGEPMALTLRAAGNITMNGSLSDGFAAPVSTPDGNIFAVAALLPSGTRSASLTLVAGANLADSDPDGIVAKAALAAGEGSIIFNDPHNDAATYPIASVLRTGTGDLTLAAGRDISLLTPFGIYTAGYQSDVSGFNLPARPKIKLGVPATALTYLGYKQYAGRISWDSLYIPSGAQNGGLNESYPIGGGNLKITLQGNLTSAVVKSPDDITVSNGAATSYAGSEVDTFWLWTMGQANLPSQGRVNGTWFINFGTYFQTSTLSQGPAPDVAAFRGFGAFGGGNATVTVGGQMSNVDVSVPTTGYLPTGGQSLVDAVVRGGGGSLSVNVATQLTNANLLIGQGTANIHAQDLGTPNVDHYTNAGTPVDVLVGEAQAVVTADRTDNLFIGDPTRAALQWNMLLNKNSAVQYFPYRMAPKGLEGCGSGCTTGGWTDPQPAPWGFFTTQTANTSVDTRTSGGDVTLSGDYVPSRIDAVAPAGSIWGGGFSSGVSNDLLIGLPSQTAQLDLLAGQAISNIGISQSGALPSASGAPIYYAAGTIVSFHDIWATPSSLNLADETQPYDLRTNRVYAVAGNVNGALLATTKQTDVQAGRDVAGPIFELQNNNPYDISLIQAGRDITDQYRGVIGSCCATGLNVRLGGPGELEFQAGRNLTSQGGIGVATIGNADNPALKPGGASISVNVGVGAAGPDLDAFISTYFDPANAGKVIQSYSDDLIQYMAKYEGKPTLSAAQALADFRALTPAQQLPFVQQEYFAELKAGGEAAANGQGAGGKGYDRAYKAIQTLFPGSNIGTPTTAYSGNLSLYGLGSIRTLAGGGIDILAPGGSVTLGFENQTPNLAGQTDTARPGLLTLRGGTINTFTDASVIVAQSRVFTELGGDILMFSTNGDLNAGKGKKTTLVTSPPQFTVDRFGNVTKAPVTPQTGAGIATLIGVPGVLPGNVDLFAPHGTIDAGDAGIRSSGNVTLQALQILNASNIQAQGTTIGVPVVQAPPVAALTAASNTAGAGVRTEGPPQPAASDSPSVIVVEFLGFGGDDDPSKPRQKSDGAKDKQSYDPTSSIQYVGAGELSDQQRQKLTPEELSRLAIH